MGLEKEIDLNTTADRPLLSALSATPSIPVAIGSPLGALRAGERYYFAYGSNLNRPDLARWCVAANARVDLLLDGLQPMGAAVLPDFALVFDKYSAVRQGGVLNVIPHPGSMVEGVLFTISQEALALIRRKEGVRPDGGGSTGGYEEAEVFVIDPATGSEVRAVTHLVKTQGLAPHVEPSLEYLRICREGREAYGISQHHLHGAQTSSRNPHFESPLFLYGTLLSGECRSRLVEGAAQQGARTVAVAQGVLHDTGAFPMLNPTGNGRVVGEVIVPADPASLFAELDQIEGHTAFGAKPRLLRRTVLRVGIEGDKVGNLAWAYVSDDAGACGQRIDCGSWRHRRATRPDGSKVGSEVVPAIYRVRQDHYVAAHSREELIDKLARSGSLPYESLRVHYEREVERGECWVFI